MPPQVRGSAEQVAQAVTAEGLHAHLAALQRIADENGGTRASGTPGYDASVEYVAEQLRRAGYTPHLQRVRYTDSHELAPPELARALAGSAHLQIPRRLRLSSLLR